MPITHISRTGSTYYLHTRRKRGGGVQYYFSKETNGSLADAIPSGFEIYESVRSQVFLRRKQPKLIQDEERACIEREIARLQSKHLYKVEVRGRTLTIFESANHLDRLADVGSLLSPPKDTDTKRALQERLASYQAVLRFILADSELRLFEPERFCFRGSVDDWISIGPIEPLKKLAAKYIRHLGRDSIYDLY